MSILSSAINFLGSAGASIIPIPTSPVVLVNPIIAKLSDMIKAAAPQADIARWLPAFQKAFDLPDMTMKRAAAALGQFVVEAGESFNEIEENLFYRSGQRLADVFPRCFPAAIDAAGYIGKPELTANRVYANINGNGNEASGDGWKFRGGGMIQLTGRENYAKFAAAQGIGIDDAAALVRTDKGAIDSGLWYIYTHGCMSLADVWNLDGITRIVNGRRMLEAEKRAARANAALKAGGG